jgi:hypothetical protein
MSGQVVRLVPRSDADLETRKLVALAKLACFDPASCIALDVCERVIALARAGRLRVLAPQRKASK